MERLIFISFLIFPLTLFHRLLSEYLGLDTMLAIVCKTYEGVKALENYDGEGSVNSKTGLHGLGSSIGRRINGRFLVICLEDIRQESPTLLCLSNYWYLNNLIFVCS